MPPQAGDCFVGFVPALQTALFHVGYSKHAQWLTRWLRACRNVFKTAPSTLNIPDYYDLIDRKHVITWPSLKKRQHTSRKALLADLGRMTHNAAVYNTGAPVRNPAFTPGGAEPEFVKRGPGKHAFPAVVPLMRSLQKRVAELLEGKYRIQVRPAARACAGAPVAAQGHRGHGACAGCARLVRGTSLLRRCPGIMPDGGHVTVPSLKDAYIHVACCCFEGQWRVACPVETSAVRGVHIGCGTLPGSDPVTAMGVGAGREARAQDPGGVPRGAGVRPGRQRAVGGVRAVPEVAHRKPRDV